MMHKSLPIELRVLRAREGLTLKEAAEQIGIGRDTLSDIERGKQRPVLSTLAKIAEGYGVPVEHLLEEPALPLAEVPDTGLAALSPDELETRVFGAPVQEGEEPKPIIDALEADAMAREIRRQRDELGRWLEKYAEAPSPARFAARADAEEAQIQAMLAQAYWLVLIDVWSKLADPRDVPFKGASQLVSEVQETFADLIFRATESKLAERTEGRAG
jgi:transcriptional regulator with XRE-family HTH domain